MAIIEKYCDTTKFAFDVNDAASSRINSLYEELKHHHGIAGSKSKLKTGYIHYLYNRLQKKVAGIDKTCCKERGCEIPITASKVVRIW